MAWCLVEHMTHLHNMVLTLVLVWGFTTDPKLGRTYTNKVKLSNTAVQCM